MGKSTVRVHKSGPTALDTKASGRTTKQMDTVYSTTPTATPMTACGSTIKLTAMACTNMRMVLATQANGSKTASTAKGVKHGPTELNTKADTKTERKKVRVN